MPDFETLQEIKDMGLWDPKQEKALEEAIELMELLAKDPFAMMVERQRELSPQHPAKRATVDD